MWLVFLKKEFLFFCNGLIFKHIKYGVLFVISKMKTRGTKKI